MKKWLHYNPVFLFKGIKLSMLYKVFLVDNAPMGSRVTKYIVVCRKPLPNSKRA